MAAKPTKPPGSILKSLLSQHNNNKNQQQQNNENDVNTEDNCSLQHSTTATNSTRNPGDSDLTTGQIATAAKKNNCSCSNISIMHLFHEMKQEFPTLPDTIVAQCVNENCHQRENCIQMLKHELELNPIPAQSYPAKVLHPPNNNNINVQNNTTTTAVSQQKPPLQQKPFVVQQKPPLKPIKPTRTAPLQPPTQQQTNGKIICAKTNSLLNKNNSNKPSSGENITTNNEEFLANGAGGGGIVDTNDRQIKITQPFKQSTITTTTASSTTKSSAAEVCNYDDSDKYSAVGIGEENIERNLPRQRPTTLNLNTQLQKQQQQQRQRLNIQLQQRFQEQRNRQQQQQQPQNINTITKPLRKAPLPPIAPKPSQQQLSHNHNAVNDSSLHRTTTTTTSPLSESEISVSVSLSTPSPTSSSSPNTSTHHHHSLLNKTTQPQTSTTNHQQQHFQTKSPIRHRSVITLQPEPPYTRDFLFTQNPSASSSPSIAASKPITATNSSSSSVTSSPTASVAGSQKSFTSVNLTLRPPVSPNGPNSALQPSTIDITAGPGFSGASGGGKSLHYSSTSYDARLGCQQNFQITVTDECGVFTASRVRPQQQQQQQQRCLNQQQLQLQQQQQFHNNNVVALQQNIQNSIQSPQGGKILSVFGGGTSPYLSGNMCLPPQQAMDAPTLETLQRQKKKRDKLAAALREYKKRLGNVEQEINLLTGTITTEGLSERLDDEIMKLRRDCQDMLRSSNTFTQPPPLQQELAINHQPQQSMYYHQQQPPQPFLRQRITRPSQRQIGAPRQTSLDIIQHHSQISTPHTPPAASLPNLNLSPLQLQQLQQSNQSMPPYFHQQSSPANNNFVNNNDILYTDHSTYDEHDHLVEDDADDYDEYEEVIEQPWECNMCTFRNHPQLNICETCENVRIIPGRLTNLSRALSASNCTNSDVTASNVVPPNLGGLLRSSSSNNTINNSNSSSRNGLNAANGNLEHDTNLVQQQLQHFALHT